MAIIKTLDKQQHCRRIKPFISANGTDAMLIDFDLLDKIYSQYPVMVSTE